MAIKRVHLIYPHGPAINCPETIGRHLGQFLGRHYPVTVHHWATVGSLQPDPETALIGHPHPSPLTLFRRSAAKGGWGRVLMLAPINGEARQMGWYLPALRNSDAFLAITGPYWWKALAQSPLGHWKPRMRHLDLAVDRQDFPRVKRSFAAAGKRRFLYVGHSGWPKNTDYLAALARQRPDWDFAWAGGGKAIPDVRSLGRLDFSKTEAQRLVAGYDFMLTVGTSDANPATILEAMAWGLIPVCTPQSGYQREAGIVNVPLDDADGALRILDGLQQAPVAKLRTLVARNDRALKAHYHWERFGAEVLKALRVKGRLPLPEAPAGEALKLAWQIQTCPNRPLRWRWLAQAVYQLLVPRWRRERTVQTGGPWR